MHMSALLNFQTSSLSFAMALALTACGGGASSSSDTPTSATTPVSPTPTIVPITPAVSTTVAIVGAAAPQPNTYSTEELATFNVFNTARLNCGFGALQQSTQLDVAALNHTRYQVENSVVSHNEITGNPGFTGITLTDRLTAANYLNYRSAGEVIASLSAIAKPGWGSKLASNLMAAPYHLLGLMQGNREIGISFMTGGPIGSGADITYAGAPPTTLLTADMGSSATLLPQAQDANSVLTYPCQGTTGTAWQMTDETPNPVAPRNLATNPIGQPIFVQALSGQTLVILSASVTGPLGSVALLPTLTAANDQNAHLSGNQAILMPNLPVAPTASYTVSITGTHNGTAFAKTFSFTTGS
jgi:uncharacterized protein YkwD